MFDSFTIHKFEVNLICSVLHNVCICIDYIAKYGRMTEAAARKKFWQILSAVEYCHNRHVVHRDLKVRNCVIKKIIIFRIILMNTFLYRRKICYLMLI